MKRLLLILFTAYSSLFTLSAQQTTDIDRLMKDMYKYFNTDSIDRFMTVTDSLKQLCQKTGDETTFYKAWSNQATFTFTKKSREEGLAIAKEERTYAEQHDSKWGLYSSTSAYATMMSSIGMIDEAENAFLEAIDYLRRFFPKESAAFHYIGLAKIELNRSHFDKTVDYAEKTLAEPNTQPIHQLHAYNYLCAGLGELSDLHPDDASIKQRFNKAFAERAAVMKTHQLSDAMGGIVNYYEAQVNGRYNELPDLAQKIVNKINRLAYIPRAWAAMGDYQKAYEAFMVFKAYSDSVNSAEILQAASEYGIQLDLARAENEMKDLRLANQEHKEHIHHIIMSTIGIIALIIITALAFYLYRRNKHSKEIEEAYNKLEDAYSRLETTTAAKERIESELRIAHDIQMGMVPHNFPAFPDRKDIDIYASLTPAKEVGGDLYDFLLQNDKLYFCIGDVAGKGVPASLFMSVVVNIFRMVAKEGFPPQYIITKLNDALSIENENGMFCTIFIGEVDLRTGQLQYCNAGHNQPLVIDRPQTPLDPCRPSYIEMESNAPIGLWPDLEYIGETINIKDRILFLYTDGLTEAENLSQEQFGEERLINIFKNRPFDSTRQTIEAVKSTVASFIGNAEASDDLTMLCLNLQT